MTVHLDYQRMKKLACFVASQHVAEYDRETVHSLVEEVGWEVADEFYETYCNTFDVYVGHIRKWIDEIAAEEGV